MIGNGRQCDSKRNLKPVTDGRKLSGMTDIGSDSANTKSFSEQNKAQMDTFVMDQVCVI